jgi:hypothetical protein
MYMVSKTVFGGVIYQVEYCFGNGGSMGEEVSLKFGDGW